MLPACDAITGHSDKVTPGLHAPRARSERSSSVSASIVFAPAKYGYVPLRVRVRTRLVAIAHRLQRCSLAGISI
jgi:hypothetical protein